MSLPTQIKVQRTLTYEVKDLVQECCYQWGLDPAEVTVELVLERLKYWVGDDFPEPYNLYVTDQNGKELPEWDRII